MFRTRLAILVGGVFLLSAVAAAQTPGVETGAGMAGDRVKPPSDDAGACACDEFAPETSVRWTVGAEYLLWWLREGRAPPLLTTGPATSQGILGNDGTRVLYGNDRLETRHGDRFNGIRLTAGYWFEDAQTIGLEGRAFFLERDSTYFKATSPGDVLLARPYSVGGEPTSQIIAGPGPAGDLSGGFIGYSRVEFFGQEANLVTKLVEIPRFRADLIAGARFLQMRDRADFTSSGRVLPAQAILFGTEDHFRTHDFFYGGQLGLRGEYDIGRWFVNLRGTAAVGGNAEQVRAFGDHLYQTPTQRTDLPYGLLVQTGNTGTFSRTVVSGVFEVGGNLGYQVTSWCRAFAGYTLLWWDSPIRAADQADLLQSPGWTRPGVPFREDFFWAQGVNAGLQLTW